MTSEGPDLGSTHKARKQIVAKRIDWLSRMMCELMPPAEAEQLYWLESDPGPDLCRAHAIKRRADEFGLGPHIDRPWYCRTELEDIFWDGISCHYPAAEAEGARFCEECGELLEFTLTDYGMKEELACFQDCDFDKLNPELIYILDTMASGVGVWTDSSTLAGVSAVLKRAVKSLINHAPTEHCADMKDAA